MKRLSLTLLLANFVLSSGASESSGADASNAKDRKSTDIKSYVLREYHMDDVVITATRTPLPLKNSPVITRVISGEYIAKQGIPTLENLLERELAGVEFHQAGYGTTVSFQGLDARYVLFLVDGERMAGETYGNIDYERIPISIIERVEIVRGASSVLYGSNAMGAIVNIITKMPKNKVEVNASFRYGTPFQSNNNETLGGSSDSDIKKYRDKLDLPNTKTDLSIGFNLGKFRSLTTAVLQTTDAYKLTGSKDELRHYGELRKMMPKMNIIPSPGGPPKIEMVFDNGIPVFEVPEKNGIIKDTSLRVAPDKRGLGVSGWKNWYLGQKFDYRINDKFRLELSGNYYRKFRYDFRNSIMDDNPMSGVIERGDPWKYESYKGYDGKFLMEHSPNDRNKIYLTFMRDEYFRDKERLGQKAEHKQRHTYNIPRLLWTSRIGSSHRLTTGVEMINERLRFDLNPNGGYDAVKSMSTAAVYVQDEILSGRKLSFVVGARADWNDRFGWRATPQASAKYIFNDFSLRGNYSNGYRSPSLKEMYMELSIPMPGSPKILGNPKLKAETNHYLSLSLDYNREWLNLSATVNKSYFKNKIDVRWIGNDSGRAVMQYDNIERSEYGSIELIGRFRLMCGLFINANYNYIYQSDNAPESSTQYIFPSPHTATLSVDYSFMGGKKTRISLNANVRYIGAKDYEDFMTYINLPQPLVDYIRMAEPRPPIMSIPGMQQAMKEFKYFTGSYRSHQDGYAICNVSADFNYLRKCSITIGVNNLFNYQPKVVNFNSALTPKVNGFIKAAFYFNK